MDILNSNTIIIERKRGQHLGLAERGAIQVLHEEGYSNRKIAKILNCSPSTVGYELKRGTPTFSGRGRRPKYSARRAHKVYLSHRAPCHRKRKEFRGSLFIPWLASKLLGCKWSIDECHGRALLKGLFPMEDIPCTKTLYNMLHQNRLPITMFDCPEILSRRIRKATIKRAKRLHGESIDSRPKEVDERNTFGHWEIDSVLGKKTNGESAALTIVERLTGYIISIKLPAKSSEAVEQAIVQLQNEFGEQFSVVFRSITTDNGSEFATLSNLDLGDTKVYYAHPYSSWERPINERSNRLLRQFLPKGRSMNGYIEDDIRRFSDEINSIPRRRLDYCTAEELFDQHLDQIYRLNVY